MFYKLNQLIKENTKEEIFLNAGIEKESLGAAISEASGVIIDVLKTQLDSGKVRDLMSSFKGKKTEQELLIKMMVKKYTNRLNSYHGVAPEKASELALAVIPTVMKRFVLITATNVKEEKFLFKNGRISNCIITRYLTTKRTVSCPFFMGYYFILAITWHIIFAIYYWSFSPIY
jgi:hypothetical protein